MATKKQPNATQIVVQEIEHGEITCCLLGDSPLISNRFQQKAWQELLLGTPPRNKVELASRLKHDPVAEFRGSLYRNRDGARPALFHVPPGAIHGALAAVALDVEGAKKAQIERLTRVVDINIDLFGIPQLFMAMVRNSDMNRTPDVRTRATFREWACKVTVRYVRPQLTERVICNLLGAAGLIVGIGDWRGQKGGSYGSWRLVAESDADYRRIVTKQGRAVQQKAFDAPSAYDADSEELFAWYEQEVKRREMDESPAKKSRGRVFADAKKSRGRVFVEKGDGQFVTIETNADRGGKHVV